MDIDDDDADADKGEGKDDLSLLKKRREGRGAERAAARILAPRGCIPETRATLDHPKRIT